MSLDNLRNLPWTIQISRTQSGVVVYCPELKIIGKGQNLSAAVENFETKQQNYFSEMMNNGLEKQIPYPRAVQRRKRLIHALGLFWLKHFALALFYAMVFIGAGKIVGKQIGKGFSQINKEWNNFTAADGSPDKARRLENFQEDISRLTPFMKEMRKAWKESEK